MTCERSTSTYTVSLSLKDTVDDVAMLTWQAYGENRSSTIFFGIDPVILTPQILESIRMKRHLGHGHRPVTPLGSSLITL